MKASFIFFFVYVVQSTAFLQLDIFSISFDFFNPLFGNVTKQKDNDTHIGEFRMFVYQDISDFDINLVFTTREGKAVSKFSVKPCLEKSAKKLNLSSIGQIEKPKGLPGHQCPILKGEFVVNAKLKSTRLPLVVPSFHSTPGQFTKRAYMITKQNKKPETVFTSIESFEIQVVQ